MLRDLAPYLPRSIYDRLLMAQGHLPGDFRLVTNLFVYFDGLDVQNTNAGEWAQAYHRWAHSIVDRYEGRLHFRGPSATAEGQRNTNLPRPSTWVNGPGGIKPDARPWEQVSKEYEFVNHFCLLRPLVRGPGNLERFYYWLNNFRYLRAVGQVNCTWARFNAAMKKVKDTKEPDARKRLARQTALPLRQQLVAQVADVEAEDDGNDDA